MLIQVLLKTLENEFSLEAIGLKSALKAFIERSFVPPPPPPLPIIPSVLRPNEEANSPPSEEPAMAEEPPYCGTRSGRRTTLPY